MSIASSFDDADLPGHRKMLTILTPSRFPTSSFRAELLVISCVSGHPQLFRAPLSLRIPFVTRSHVTLAVTRAYVSKLLFDNHGGISKRETSLLFL